VINQELVRKIAYLERRLDNLAKPEAGWTPHFLDEPYTNADFDGDSFSNVAVHTKIENTSWSTTIPSNARALMIRGDAKDSGSAANTTLYFRIYSTATATLPAFFLRPAGITNDAFTNNSGNVPCTNGDIWYRVNASGASTMDVYLYVVGYWT
jgi:hypothetical protein